MASPARLSRVAVVGGGLSGLSAAYHLARAAPHVQVVVLERSARVGGWVHTSKVHHVDGDAIKSPLILDTGPHSVRSGVLAYDMCEMVSQCGIADKVLLANHTPEGSRRYVYTNNTLNTLPMGLKDLVTRPGVFGRGLLMAAVSELFKPKRTDSADETVYAFAQRRFGEATAVHLFGAMVHGIYAGDFRQLSLRACFPILHKTEQAAGSVVKGMLTGASQTKKETNAIAVKLAAYDADTQKLIDRLKGSAAWGLEGGMQTLVDAIRTQLNAMPNVEVRTDSECTSVVSSSSGVVVQVRNGPNSQTTGAPETLTVDHVMLTVSSLDASRLLTAPENATDTGCVRNATDPLVSGASSFGRLTRLLRSTPFTSVGVVNLVYDTDILKHKGFGLLVADRSNNGVLGIIFDSCVFPEQNGDRPNATRLTVMVDLCRKSHSLSDAERSNTTAQLNEHIAMVSRDAVRDILGHNGPPTTQQVRIQKHCIPQYQLGHLERMGEIDWLLRATTKGCVSVLGSSYRGVSVNDCVRFAKNTAKGLAQGKMVTGLSDV